MKQANPQRQNILELTGIWLMQLGPTFLVIVWLLSATIGWGFGDLFRHLLESQPVGPLAELIISR